MNPKTSTLRHTVLKTLKVEDKDYYRAAREQNQNQNQTNPIYIQGNPVSLSAGISAETLQARVSDMIYSKF